MEKPAIIVKQRCIVFNDVTVLPAAGFKNQKKD
jgi:hypothetical protein